VRPEESVLEGDLIDVTVNPVLAWLQCLDQRVSCLVVVLRGVLVLGLITTADPTAAEAGSQVDPGVAHRHAAVADVAGGLDGLYEFEMRAVGGTFSRHEGRFEVFGSYKGGSFQDGLMRFGLAKGVEEPSDFRRSDFRRQVRR
jgi:hypothetical protein